MQTPLLEFLEEREIQVQTLSHTVTDACCILEAECFNELRKAWGQPFQSVRQSTWLNYQADHFPDNTLVLIKDQRIAGWIMVHQWGSLGWMGPVVIAPSLQGLGLGRRLVAWSIEHLLSLSCTSIGLETWSYNMTNVGLYVKAGFDISSLICVLEKECSHESQGEAFHEVSSLKDFEDIKSGLIELGRHVLPGLDYSPLAENLLACGMGTVVAWGDRKSPEAMAILRDEPYTSGPSLEYTNIEAFLVRPDFRGHLKRYLSDLGAAAAQSGKESMRLSVNSKDPALLQDLLSNQRWKLIKTRLRMMEREQGDQLDSVNCVSFSV